MLVFLFYNAILSCTPECRWMCDDPVCAPACEIRCPETLCEQNTCSLQGCSCGHFSEGRILWCEAPDENSSMSVCDVKSTGTDCTTAQGDVCECSSECMVDACYWDCTAPVTCAAPQCELSCERPSCETTH
jgi:hypothetical protein